MHISINNSLPSVSLYLDIPVDDVNRMRLLVDIGGLINTVNLMYHIWVISQYPKMMNVFLQYGKDDDCNVVHLLTVLDLNEVATDIDHGQITVVICYKTTHSMNGKGPFILSFTLGNDISVRSVLGSLTRLAMGAAINLVSGLLSCVELKHNFPLELNHQVKIYPMALI